MKRPVIAILFAIAAAVTLFSARPAAAADHRGHHGYAGHAVQRYNSWSYRQPVYRAPAVHVDTQFHVEPFRWTPWQGFHGNGHYDATPHITPSHFDYGYGGHMDANPWFHH